jgi:hypothetical protein
MSADIEARLAEVEQRQRAQGEILVALESVGVTVNQLSETVADLQLAAELDGSKDKVKPWMNPRWWRLTDEEKEAELGRLRGWLDQVGSPLLGITRLPDCLAEHMLVVLLIDAVSELFRCLYIPESRSMKIVAAQTELLIRVLPGIKAEIHKALTGCDHQAGLAQVRQIEGTR